MTKSREDSISNIRSALMAMLREAEQVAESIEAKGVAEARCSNPITGDAKSYLLFRVRPDQAGRLGRRVFITLDPEQAKSLDENGGKKE